jgi:small-conductance mechanosensitive channel
LAVFMSAAAQAQNGSGADGRASPSAPPLENQPPAPAANAENGIDAQKLAAERRAAEFAADVRERVNREIGRDINDTLSRWNRDLERVEQGLAVRTSDYGQLDLLREQLERVRGDVTDFLSTLEPRLNAVNTQAAKLGEAPVEGQPAEPEEVARTRAELLAVQATYHSARSVAAQVLTRTNQLIGTLQEIRRARFMSRLLERSTSVMSLTNWARFPANAVQVLEGSAAFVGEWWRSLGFQGGRDAQAEAMQIFAATAFLWLMLFLLERRGAERLRVWTGEGEPPFWRRAGSSAGVILLRALPVCLPALFLYHALAGSGLISERADWLFYSITRAAIIVAVVNALVKTVFAPNRPEWRLIPASDVAAARLRWLAVALASVYALHMVTNTLTRIAGAPLSFAVIQSFIACLVVAGLLFALLRNRLDAPLIEGAPELKWLRVLRVPVLILAAAIALCALLGYVAMARFIATQLIVTGTILTVVYLLMVWVDAFGQSFGDEQSPAGRWLSQAVGFDRRRRDQVALPVTLLLKAAVLFTSVPLILLQWGFSARDVGDWLRELFFGFQIGNTQISIAAILASVIVFMIGYLAAKLFQGWLDKQVLAQAGLSGSVRDSIRTGVGYLGIFIAGVFAFSYAGLDLSSLAIVAGAFSVGIGFGLQSIVSNFVSGLILLAERPIKVGDWIVVGGEEGLVRRISVRSTEIETFDRANVLVPNSHFITEKVKNWTLHNNTGRIAISVGVEYDSDPRQVRELLLQVAREHVNVMTTPEPFVLFEDFGNDALQFKLFVFVYDLTKGIGTRTDLRIAIFEAFRAAGVGIPFRQTDVKIKDMEWLREAVTGYMMRDTPAGDGQGKQPIVVPPNTRTVERESS